MLAAEQAGMLAAGRDRRAHDRMPRRPKTTGSDAPSSRCFSCSQVAPHSHQLKAL